MGFLQRIKRGTKKSLVLGYSTLVGDDSTPFGRHSPGGGRVKNGGFYVDFEVTLPLYLDFEVETHIWVCVCRVITVTGIIQRRKKKSPVMSLLIKKGREVEFCIKWRFLRRFLLYLVVYLSFFTVE